MFNYELITRCTFRNGSFIIFKCVRELGLDLLICESGNAFVVAPDNWVISRVSAKDLYK